MIDVTEAVQKAKNAFSALHTDVPTSQLRMAEVELSSDDTHWLVTLAYLDDEVSAIAKHKILKIDASTGQVRSVKLRTL
ncbi:MAG: hypothetical protein K0U98_01250 [Deltaproteobacteria bacterium]|nr:hypothetical protein [Deltaproteobacteria bacterium]